MDGFHGVIVDAAQRRIDPAEALAFVSHPSCGGLSLFVGQVRERNLGRVVVGISYDVFDQLALTGFAEIATRVRAQYGSQLRIYMAHAKGRLAVGDVALAVAVGAVHRDEAFRACREAVEVLKHGSPIWKQEHYPDGSSEWSEGCSLCEVEPSPVAGAVHVAHAGHVHG